MSTRILLIDDDELLSRALTARLTADGHKVATAGTVHDAQALFESEAFDLVIHDVNLPDGDINVDDPEVIIPHKNEANKPEGGMEGLIYHFKNYMHGHGIRPAPGEVYRATEAPNGELGYYIVSDGSGRPYRWRVRPPSLYNYAPFPQMCLGGSVSDIVSGLSSLNIIAGELDR